MLKLLIFCLIVAVFVIALVKLLNYLVSGEKKSKYPSPSTLDELVAKASQNHQEREAIKQEVGSAEQVLEEIKSKTV